MSQIETVQRSLGVHIGEQWKIICEVPMARRGIETALAMAWMNGAGNDELKQHIGAATYDLIQAAMAVSLEEGVELIRDFRDERRLPEDNDIKFTFVRTDQTSFLIRVNVTLRKIALENTIKIHGMTFKPQ